MFGIPSPVPSVSRESSVTEPPATTTATTTAQRILLPPTVSEQRRSLSRAQVQPQQQGVTAGRRVVRPIGAPPLSLPRGTQGVPPAGGITEALQKALSSFANLGDGNADTTTTTTSALLGRPSATLVDEAPHRLLFIIDQLAQELHKERSIRRCYQQQVVPLLLKKIDELEHVERDAMDRLVDLQRTVEGRMTELRSVHGALNTVDAPTHRGKQQQQEDLQMLCGEARELLNTLWENVR